MPGIALILGGVAVALPVLDAHAHGKGLGLHGNAQVPQHEKRVPGGVSGAEDQLAAGDGLCAAGRLHGDAVHRAAGRLDAGQAVLEADVRPQGEKLLPQAHQGDVEIIGTHMGLGVDEDVLRGAALHQRLQNEAVAHVSGAGIELAVRKGAGTALAELHVGAEVQRAGAPEPLHVLLALFHAASPLQQNGLQARPGQHQRGEQASRSRAYHHRGDLGRRLGRGQRIGDLPLDPGDLLAVAALHDARLIPHRGDHRINKAHILPGVHTAPDDPQVLEFFFPHL